jgi:hypothetical protein
MPTLSLSPSLTLSHTHTQNSYTHAIPRPSLVFSNILSLFLSVISTAFSLSLSVFYSILFLSSTHTHTHTLPLFSLKQTTHVVLGIQLFVTGERMGEKNGKREKKTERKLKERQTDRQRES